MDKGCSLSQRRDLSLLLGEKRWRRSERKSALVSLKATHRFLVRGRMHDGQRVQPRPVRPRFSRSFFFLHGRGPARRQKGRAAAAAYRGDVRPPACLLRASAPNCLRIDQQRPVAFLQPFPPAACGSGQRRPACLLQLPAQPLADQADGVQGPSCSHSSRSGRLSGRQCPASRLWPFASGRAVEKTARQRAEARFYGFLPPADQIGSRWIAMLK